MIKEFVILVKDVEVRGGRCRGQVLLSSLAEAIIRKSAWVKGGKDVNDGVELGVKYLHVVKKISMITPGSRELTCLSHRSGRAGCE